MVLLHMYAMRGIMWYCVSYSYNVLLSNTVLITPIFFLIWASLIHNVVLRRWKGVFCPFPCYNWSRDLVFFTGHGWYHLFSTTYRAHRLWNSDSKSNVCGKTLQFYLTEWQKVPFYLRMSLLNKFCLKVPCLNCPVLAYAHSQRIAKWELCTLHVFLSINYRQFHNFIVSSVLIECWGIPLLITCTAPCDPSLWLREPISHCFVCQSVLPCLHVLCHNCLKLAMRGPFVPNK